MLVKIGAQGYENWGIEVEVQPDTTVARFKELIAAPPHLLAISAKTKVLWRRANNCLMALLDDEKVRSNIVLINAYPTVMHLSFPTGFLWGAATAAYQIEGATMEGGRTPCIWDTFAGVPGSIADGDRADVACDHYHRFKEDVKLMKELGLPAYRFSISWPRLLPRGRGEVNKEAVDFYGALLDELVSQKIEPMVTLYHWDLPQCLEDEYGGWLGRQVVEDFEHYAAACFQHFGSRVRYWVTINEPWCAAVLGYASGEHAPGRKSAPAQEPYQVAHHMLLAHAHAVRRYRSEFRSKQFGRIGMALNMDWKEPLTSTPADLAAQGRALDWQLGWFAEPIYRGQYPSSMRMRCRERLPTFTEAEQKLVKGSADFFGLNHYSSDYVAADPKQRSNGYFDDQEVKNSSDPNWPKTGMGWDIVPWGLQRLLSWIHREYSPTGGIIITENGYAVEDEDADEAEADAGRVEYFQGYLTQMHRAIQSGADVRGYFAWSLMDNFEWAFGFTKRFGLVRVDYTTQRRSPKASARMMSELARLNVLTVPTRVLEDSDFAPLGAPKRPPPEKPAPLPEKPQATKATPKAAGRAKSEQPASISIEDSLQLLGELSDRYQSPEFQQKMEGAYRNFQENSSNLALSKARQAICLPIQAIVLPKYGFEPSAAGVNHTVMLLQAPERRDDPNIKQLTSFNNFLLSDLPRLRVQEEARHRDELEVLEAMSLGKEEAAAKAAAASAQAASAAEQAWPEAPKLSGVPVLDRAQAMKLLSELLSLYQHHDVQHSLEGAYKHIEEGLGLAPLLAVFRRVAAQALSRCGLFDYAGGIHVDFVPWLTAPQLSKDREVQQRLPTLVMLMHDLPSRRAKQELALRKAAEAAGAAEPKEAEAAAGGDTPAAPW